MSEDINKVILIGRVVRDSELLYTNSGYALCKFDLAVNRRRKQGDQWIDEGHFFEVNIWGRRGESLTSYLVRGALIGVEGALRQQRWEQDGVKHSRIIVEASNIELLGGNRSGSGNGGGQGGGPQGQSSQRSGQPGGVRGATGGHQGGQGRGNNQSRPPQNGGPDSFESYTPPENPEDYQEYEDDIPF